MKTPLFFVFFSLVCITSKAQTCTVTGTSPLDWPTNGAGIVCSGGGNAVGKTTVVIPAGFTVNFNDNADTWTGTTIEIHGRMNVTSNPTINASILVKNGGVLNLIGKLSLGSAAGCPYTLVVAAGGTVTVGGTGSDRLTICGQDIMKGNGACNDCGGTDSGQCPSNGQPYCQPPGGFTGPSGYDQGGFDASLPVKLLYFEVNASNETIEVKWATTMEENFYKFVVQRSDDGINFEEIGEVLGQGFNIHDIQTRYSFVDEVPLMGMNYYRLKAIDLDNSYEYFDVKSVKVDARRNVAVYPNPSTGEGVSFRSNFHHDESDRIVIIDQVGVEVFNAPATGTEISFPNALRPGIYMLRYIGGNHEQVHRIIIQK